MSVIMKRNGQRTGKVMVLGDDNRSFLAVIRSLGRRNLCVHVGWHSPNSSALSSKYVAKTHDILPYSPNDDSWKDSLLAILRKEQFDLVIPCNDQTIIPLQKHRADLERFASIYLLDGKVYETVCSKAKVNELARSLDIAIAKEMKVSCLADSGTILSEFQLPVVLKPCFSFSEENIVDRNYVRKAYNPEELNVYLQSLSKQGVILVQENFIGTGVGVELLVEHGRLLMVFQHIRIHEPLMGGGSSYRKSVSCQPELLDAAAKLMKAMNYTGVAMVEFKVNFDTGDWVFIEINGRFWGSLPLAVSAKADFPYALYQLLVEGRQEFPQDYRKGIYCRNLLSDLVWFLQNLRADRSDPTLATLSPWQVAREVVNMLKLKERSDTFVMDDPKPGFVELVNLIYTLRTMVLGKIGLFLLSLSTIRKLYSHRTRRALSKARIVLFVCKGNICRSPFAQHYARTVFPESVNVMSSGYFPKEGRVCPKEAVAVAKELGIDLTMHLSITVTEEIVHQAQIIFTFDEENRRVLAKQYPSAKSKIHRLCLLAHSGPIIIKDPYGGNIDDFKDVYETIARIIDSYLGR